MKSSLRSSLIALLIASSFISLFRMNQVQEHDISWDVLGYYIYLPATFIHKDPLLTDISWLEKANENNELTGTLYMVSQNEEGHKMYFFLMGMAFFYLPFFLCANAYASFAGFPVDGFGLPYQYFLVAGGIIYTIIGIIFLRKILLRFFSDGITAAVLIIMVFGTNYIHHLTIDNLATVNILFMLVSILTWNTIKWHESFKRKHLIAIGLSFTLIALVKPSEVFAILIPLLWNVTSIADFKEKFTRLWSNKNDLLITAGLCLLIALPQLSYWQHMTGFFLHDSYKNPGVGLDYWSPHIIDVLFSYRKGWFIYTPVMIFSMIGFYFMYKSNRKVFYASAAYFLISFFIIASWTEWWYGAAYSMRPLITTYPILAISMGYFLLFVWGSKTSVKVSTTILVIFFIFLNQFQWWQLRNYILDPYRTTKQYYWATFLKTSKSLEDMQLLSVYRDFTGNMDFNDEHRYSSKVLLDDHFLANAQDILPNGEEIQYYHIDGDSEYVNVFKKRFDEITEKDHIWVKATMKVRFESDRQEQAPMMVFSMERKGGPYGYKAFSLDESRSSGEWKDVELTFITPEIRSTKDRLNCYIWNRDKVVFAIADLQLTYFERIEVQ